jgi:hypothetical protein
MSLLTENITQESIDGQSHVMQSLCMSCKKRFHCDQGMVRLSAKFIISSCEEYVFELVDIKKEI